MRSPSLEITPWDAKVKKEPLRQPRQRSRLDRAKLGSEERKLGWSGPRERARCTLVYGVNGNFLEGLAKKEKLCQDGPRKRS